MARNAIVNDTVQFDVISLGGKNAMLVHELLSTNDKYHPCEIHVSEQQIQQKASDDCKQRECHCLWQQTVPSCKDSKHNYQQ